MDWNKDLKKIKNNVGKYAKVAVDAVLDSNPVTQRVKEEIVKDLAESNENEDVTSNNFKASFIQFDQAVNKTLNEDPATIAEGVKALQSMVEQGIPYFQIPGNISSAKFFIADGLWGLARKENDKQKAKESLSIFTELRQQGVFEFVAKEIDDIESFLVQQ